MIIIVMGVSGCGKTTVGKLLAGRLGCRFLDADDFHSPENVARMRQGIALNDADRADWLVRLRAEITNHLAQRTPLVLACSALREAYRRQLAHTGEPIVFVYLRGTFEQINARLQARTGHYMPAALLSSQFATLEEPAQAIAIPVDLEPEAAVAQVLQSLPFRSPSPA